MMRIKLRTLTPVLAAAAVTAGLATAPTALAVDPCTSAVSSSRCLGPQGIDGFAVPDSSPGSGFQTGPYGPWGAIPPLG